VSTHVPHHRRLYVHGFAVLEAEGAFGLSGKLDDTYDLLIHMLTTGMHAPRYSAGELSRRSLMFFCTAMGRGDP
jgi:hypothetical protein